MSRQTVLSVMPVCPVSLSNLSALHGHLCLSLPLYFPPSLCFAGSGRDRALRCYPFSLLWAAWYVAHIFKDIRKVVLYLFVCFVVPLSADCYGERLYEDW